MSKQRRIHPYVRANDQLKKAMKRVFKIGYFKKMPEELKPISDQLKRKTRNEIACGDKKAPISELNGKQINTFVRMLDALGNIKKENKE